LSFGFDLWAGIDVEAAFLQHTLQAESASSGRGAEGIEGRLITANATGIARIMKRALGTPLSMFKNTPGQTAFKGDFVFSRTYVGLHSGLGISAPV
jgi:hypothetical protein